MADGLGVCPPSSNRGGKSSPVLGEVTDGLIRDFLSFTFQERDLGRGLPDQAWHLKALAEGDDGAAHALFARFFADAFGTALVVGRELRGFRQFYDNHFLVFAPDGSRCGFVAWGGERQRHTVSVQLTGAACAHVKAWAHAAEVLGSVDAKLTRVDLAYDDLRGVHDLALAERLYEAGKFTTNGRPPSCQRLGWEDGSGRSFYVGKDRGHRQLCVYEKGREQGSRDGDELAAWVRWEARFGAAYAAVPLDILTDPASYYVGQYPALTFVRAVAKRIATNVGKAASNFARAARHARSQCGRFLWAVRETVGESGFLDFVSRELVVKRLPDWYAFNPAASPVAARLVAV